MKKKPKKIKWLPEIKSKDFIAAESYLSLHFGLKAIKITQELTLSPTFGEEHKPNCIFKAKDIFRASGLSLLGVSNSHVKKDQKKIKKGIPLSPIIIVRFNNKPIIADGYHRLCAVYSFNEDAEIPCKIID